MSKPEIEEFIGKRYLSNKGIGCVLGEQGDGGVQIIAQIQGYDATQTLFKDRRGKIDYTMVNKFQDELGKFVADVINEKLDRET